MQRHLIVCCDGTWNSPEVFVTNVARLYHSLAPTAEDGTEQLAYYHTGVGADGGLWNWLLGGIGGAGLSRNVQDAYQWLTLAYRPGDQISLFGFSRGAFTVRSLAGMIASCGLIDPAGLDAATVWKQIEHVYRHRYRPGAHADPHWRDGLRFTFDEKRADKIPIRFIGVWETVGSLGIPDYLGLLNLLDSPRRHDFHNVTLNPYIRHARHAVAMDERRGPFAPTIWSDPAPGQDLKQVWFPGGHLDVGGGHLQTGLSDCTLQWMIEQARDAAGLAFRKTTVDQIRPNALDMLHDDIRNVAGWLGSAVDPVLQPFFAPQPRAVPLIDPGAIDPSLDGSVYERYQNVPITGGPYRPTRVLALGEYASTTVLAHEPWNWTGLYLEPGEYTFVAHGEWRDSSIRSGPAGATGSARFRPRAAGRLLGTLIGQGEKVFRRLTGNESADFLLSRREEDMAWMSLVGVVANDAHSTKAAPHVHERIAIGAGTAHRVSQGGYLYAFANDAWGYYRNNQGSVQLTVTRAGPGTTAP